MQTSGKQAYPWRDGNRFELLVDGEAYFEAMLQAIAGARTQVCLAMYLVTSGVVMQRFSAALCEAAARGVRVYALLDAFGARGLSDSDRQRLLAGGVSLAFHNPLRWSQGRHNLMRDHRKLLIVDGRMGYTGGTGLTDDFIARPQHAAWHDVMLAITGPVLVDWEAMFLRSWRRWAGHLPQPAALADGQPTGNQRGRVIASRLGRSDLKRSLIRQLRAANRRIWLSTAYFVPTWKLRRLLARAARRGIDVRLLLPGPHTDHPAVRHAGRRHYGRLLRHGVRIFEYQPRFLHQKIQCVDDWVSLGSSNIDRWNLRWNLEANQEIDSADFSAQVTTLFETDLATSREITASHWRKRPWHRRLLERFWGWIDVWLERRH